MTKKVNVILPKKQFQTQRVGIYARVSTTDRDQLNSLIAQISALTRLTSYYPNWKLVDIYTDIASGKTGSSRKEFSRMLEDIKKEDLNIIVTKSVSRFGRDTVDALEALKVIRQANSRIIFEQENLDSQEDDADLIISIMESLAQSENEQRSENIKWGLKQRAVQGTSKLYNRKCYGYDHDENGELIINFQQAKIVKKIFNWYLEEKSVIGIVKELEKENIKSPKGKNKWPKRSIETMLENEKYTGSVKLLDSINKENYYLLKDNHEAIITEEVFDKVQKEKSSRSNLDEDNVRKSRKYSSRLKEDNKMFKFTALESLHNNMKLNDMERVVFPFRYNEKGFSCIFITDILPYRLYLSTLGDKPITFELKINNKYDTSSYMNDYSKLIEYLELKYDPNHKFKPNDFFRSLNNNIPENCNNTPNYKDVIVIAASHREIEESNKIYFCGWRNNKTGNVREGNLEKTRSAFGDDLAELCKKKNISSRWTDIDKDEEINKINDIYTM